VDGYIETMETIKPALLDLFEYVHVHDEMDLTTGRRQEPLLPKQTPALMESLRDLNAGLKKCASTMSRFERSDDKNIALAGGGLRQACRSLMKKNKATMAALRKDRGPTALEATGRDIEKDIGAFTASLVHAASWMSEAFLKGHWDKEKGLVNYPPEARAAQVARLEALFGENITMLEGYHFMNAYAEMYGLLTGKPDHE